MVLTDNILAVAKPYLEQLENELRRWKPATPRGVKLECRHFFSGAALYANGKIAASLTPLGLAVKLPEGERKELFQKRTARRLRYFPKAPIKRDYALLTRKTYQDAARVRKLLGMSIRFAIEMPG